MGLVADGSRRQRGGFGGGGGGCGREWPGEGEAGCWWWCGMGWLWRRWMAAVEGSGWWQQMAVASGRRWLRGKEGRGKRKERKKGEAGGLFDRVKRLGFEQLGVEI